MKAVYIYCEEKEKITDYMDYAYQQLYHPLCVKDIRAVADCVQLWICGEVTEDVQPYINLANEYEIDIEYIDEV